jgi:DNA-binding transcriptional ArsR family regulator
MKKRSYRSNIYNNIISELKKNALSISDLSQKIDVNWDTTRKTLEILKDLGVLDEKEEGNKRVFFIKDLNILEQEENTIMGLPLTEVQKETTKSLFKRINEIWSKKTDRPLNKTFLQKIAVNVIKQGKIENIPYGWYLFGMTCVLQCDPKEIIVKKDLIGKEYDQEIIKSVEKYSKIENTDRLMEFQYVQEGNELYLTKLRLNKDLLYEFKETELGLLKKTALNLVFSFKKEEDNEDIIELTDGFISIFGQLVNNLSIRELEDIRQNILEAFKALWNCIATYNLYKSLLENRFYEKELLNKIYLLKIRVLKSICEDYLNLLYDLVPKKEIKDDLSKFKGVQV